MGFIMKNNDGIITVLIIATVGLILISIVYMVHYLSLSTYKPIHQCTEYNATHSCRVCEEFNKDE